MRIVTSVTAMQRLARSWRRARSPISLVPTMGCLHDGHMELIRRARRMVGKSGRVVVSVYVNPIQFGPGEDFKKYPRVPSRDRRLCRDAGVDVFFAPSDRQMYPSANGTATSTYVVEEMLSKGLEGRSRPTHFRGVTTVVAKLFNIVQPDVAVFGAKDFQQAAVIKRMMRDLNFPLTIRVVPTVRESDGLALSSRNLYLKDGEREQAVALWQAIQQARQAVRRSRVGVAAGRLESELKWLIETRPAARVDYIAFVDGNSLKPVARVRRGTHMALAVFVGKTRLIDNARL